MSFLLDTDICSAYLKGNHAVGNRCIQYGGRLFVSAITVGELFTWVSRAKASPARSQALYDFFQDVTCLDVTMNVAKKFGELEAGLFDQGLSVPDLDLLNGAVALVHGLILVTHNTSDYVNIPGLALADWIIP